MKPRDGWSGVDGGYGLPPAGSDPTPAQQQAARLALAWVAVRAGDDKAGLRQALEALDLLPDQTGDPAPP